MYKGFNLKISDEERKQFVNVDDFYKVGNDLYQQRKKDISTSLNDFIAKDGTLDGSAIQETWFPKIEADIFLSHSHNDEKLAICLSGWLYSMFDVKCFIDSTVWGYSNDLLKSIDNIHCSNLPNQNTYDYDKRNLSTSHVHMMLATSLAAMIDKTECLFFLNTPNTITPKDIFNQTASPWIYNEIVISNLIRKRNPASHRRVLKLEKGGKIALSEARNFSFTYNVDLSHLKTLELDSLISWQESWLNNIPKPDYALDILYDQEGIKLLRG